MHRWLARYEGDGLEGLGDRSSRPAHCPHQTSPAVEVMVLEMRRAHPYRLIGSTPCHEGNWLVRYEIAGLEGLNDLSHRPAHCSHQMPTSVETKVLEMRLAKPFWGARRLAFELLRKGEESASESADRCLVRAGPRDALPTERAIPPYRHRLARTPCFRTRQRQLRASKPTLAAMEPQERKLVGQQTRKLGRLVRSEPSFVHGSRSTPTGPTHHQRDSPLQGGRRLERMEGERRRPRDQSPWSRGEDLRLRAFLRCTR